MSDAMINKLSTIDVATLVVLIILICIVLNFINPLITKFYSYLISKYKKETKQESLNDMVQEDHKKILEYQQNRIHDREQSFMIQKELTDCIKELKEQLADLKLTTERKFKESEERDNKRARAELKDSISRSYRMHHITGRWTAMDKESLEDLIAAYEAAGGSNSFVHSVVEKEMYTWEMIDQIEE